MEYLALLFSVQFLPMVEPPDQFEEEQIPQKKEWYLKLSLNILY